MGNSVARMGDLCMAHMTAAPTPIITGCAGTVFAESMPVALLGCIHSKSGVSGTSHPERVHVNIQGSSTVFAEGKPIVRQLDPLEDGGMMDMGAGTVFAG